MLIPRRPRPTEELDSRVASWELQPSRNWKKILNKEWLHRVYIIEELPIEEIAKIANINTSSIKSRVLELGIPLRNKKRSYTLRSERNDSWNKGLTKENNQTLKKVSERQRLKSHFANKQWRQEHLFTEEVKKKRYTGIKKALRAKWDSLTEEEKQQQLTKIWSGKKPNNSESLLATIFPKNIEYTGNGQHWVVFRDGRRKNPDFVVRPFSQSKKVIEFFGSYWHPDLDEVDSLIALYKEIGIVCWVIKSSDLKDLGSIKAQAENFVKEVTT